MGATGFNRARRLAAQRLNKSFDEVSYEQADEVLRQPALEQEQPEQEQSESEEQSDESEVAEPTREQREAELKAGNWEALRDLLKSYRLSTNKPKAQSWDEFAIPQILKHEGF